MDNLESVNTSLQRFDGLSDRQLSVVTSEMNARRKTLLAAYLLWAFLGGLGIHRFYLGDNKAGVWILVLCVVGWLTVGIFIGFVILIPLYIYLLVDAFRIPAMVRARNERLENMLVAMVRH